MSPENSTLDDLINRKQAAIGCPYPIFADLRLKNGPLYNDTLGAWVVTRFDDVRSILRDTQRFSSLSPTGPATSGAVLMSRIMALMEEPEMAAILSSPIMSRGRVAVLLNADPPDHRRQRKLVNPAFRPDRIRAFEPEIEKVARHLIGGVLDSLIRTGQCDVVANFAVGLPMTMIARALGVDDTDLARFKRWSDDIVMPVGNHAPSLDQVRGFVRSTKEFSEYFLEQLAQRRSVPQDDILSDLANGRIEDEELTADEQLGMIQQFLVAGNETTTTLITNIVKYLAENAEMQRRIRADRDLVEPLVEEMLRFEAPVGGLFRQAKIDVSIGDSEIAAGDHLWLVFASANRDESRFTDSDVVNPSRSNVKEHLAFGNGEHFCPGAGLARAEARIATNVLLDHLEDVALVPHESLTYGDSFVLRGLQGLTITARPVAPISLPN
jgi:cytochrome P450